MLTKTVYVTITRTGPGPVAGHTQAGKTRLLPIVDTARDRDWHRDRGTVRAEDRVWQPAEVQDTEQVRDREQLPAEAGTMARDRHSLTPTRTVYAITCRTPQPINNNHTR